MCKPCQCRECGSPVRPEASFCSTAHRAAWHNRRKARGSDLYDLFMALRFQRKEAGGKSVWSLLCRMASNWRAEDKAAGRESFAPLHETIPRQLVHTAVRNRA